MLTDGRKRGKKFDEYVLAQKTAYKLAPLQTPQKVMRKSAQAYIAPQVYMTAKTGLRGVET